MATSTLTPTGVQQQWRQMEACACHDLGSACLKCAWHSFLVYVYALSSFSFWLNCFEFPLLRSFSVVRGSLTGAEVMLKER